MCKSSGTHMSGLINLGKETVIHGYSDSQKMYYKPFGTSLCSFQSKHIAQTFIIKLESQVTITATEGVVWAVRKGL